MRWISSLRRVASWQLHVLGHILDPKDSYRDNSNDGCTNGGSCVLKTKVRNDPTFVMPDYNNEYDGYLREKD